MCRVPSTALTAMLMTPFCGLFDEDRIRMKNEVISAIERSPSC